MLLVIVACAQLSYSADSTMLEPSHDSFSALLGSMSKLEDKHDPKCYATAARLEDFVYGTPLEDNARFFKNAKQKTLIRKIWQQASVSAHKQGKKEIASAELFPYLKKELKATRPASGPWQITIDQPPFALSIESDVQRQYSSIAYSLRALLAVQQDSLLEDELYLPLTEDAIDKFKLFVDLYTLGALQIADKIARTEDKYTIDQPLLAIAFRTMEVESYPLQAPVVKSVEPSMNPAEMVKALIDKKIAAYEAYNQISNKVFMRNLQVYFARMPWPSTPEEAKAFKDDFQTVMMGFTEDVYLGVERVAKARKHAVIRVEDVKAFADRFIPHQINAYEDALFFPKLSADEQVNLESYDMDAFRDSGLHWRYLQWTLEKSDFKPERQLDPFSAELFVENVAQFGVLVLRMAGMAAKENGDERLKSQHLALAIGMIQDRLDKHLALKDKPAISDKLASSKHNASQGSPDFDDVTQRVGIHFSHYSSDWLSRMLRTYRLRDESTGVLDIPPAFGGSGIASEDLNNDGYLDILILSGRGNALYLNDGKGQFTDVTQSAGIDWKRKDNTYGEPRQPLIVDFNNDGLQDILITYVKDEHRLYQNLGGMRFKDITAQAGLGGANFAGGPAAAFDFNQDGLLDIYIAYFGDYVEGVSPTLARKNLNGGMNKFFINKGNMRFEDVTEATGAGHTGWGQAITHTDFDNDGWQDLIVGNDFGVNVYYKNVDGKRLEDVSARLGTDKPSFTMGIGIADINDDALPDVYISNIVTMNKDEKYVLPNQDTKMKFDANKLATMRIVEANDLFISATGVDKQYSLSQAVGRGYASTGWSWGADFFDYDNDADDDLYVLNGMNEYAVYSDQSFKEVDGYGTRDQDIFMPVSEKELNVLFTNDGGKLKNHSKGSGLDVMVNARSATYLDFDRDGDLDVAMNNYHDKAMFFENNNESSKNNALTVKLIGNPEKQSNRDAIGARLIVTLPDGNKVWREVSSSRGYLTSHPKEQHIGLAQHMLADVTIYWPNGEQQKVEGLAAGSHFTIEQDGDIQARTWVK